VPERVDRLDETREGLARTSDRRTGPEIAVHEPRLLVPVGEAAGRNNPVAVSVPSDDTGSNSAVKIAVGGRLALAADRARRRRAGKWTDAATGVSP
jgi:hypothetical protein